MGVKRPRLREWVTGLKTEAGMMLDGRSSSYLWSERWIVAVWEAPDVAGSRMNYYVQSRYLWTCRPSVWCNDTGKWLPHQRINFDVRCCVPYPEPYEHLSLGLARKRARQLADVVCPLNQRGTIAKVVPDELPPVVRKWMERSA